MGLEKRIYGSLHKMGLYTVAVCDVALYLSKEQGTGVDGNVQIGFASGLSHLGMEPSNTGLKSNRYIPSYL